MMGRSWKTEIENVTKKIIDLIVQLLPFITPLILDQFTCSLPKNVTTFHRQQDGARKIYNGIAKLSLVLYVSMCVCHSYLCNQSAANL